MEHIRQCLDVIGVDRIDHGYHVLDDEGLIDDVRRRHICLTFCTTSQSERVQSRDVLRELKRALELGLNVTVNTDDPAYMRSYYLSEVLLNTQQAVGLSSGGARNCRGSRVCGWAIDCESGAECLSFVCSAWIARRVPGVSFERW